MVREELGVAKMRFIDEVEIEVQAGSGGDGCVAFRREKYVPRGGPAGGDGGSGGSVYFQATDRKTTLQDFRTQRRHRAQNGRNGLGANKTGRSGDDLEILVPLGTLIKDPETGETLFDLKKDGERFQVCHGGRGGKGNAHFVSSTHQAPKFAQDGELGEFKRLRLELKLLADVGIIGVPNAGKSTLISKISAAKPKIANYAFTTKAPQLGVVRLGSDTSIVVADIPGLIEGASRGAGLGHRFLKHIERTKVLVHLLDGAHLLKVWSKTNDITQVVQSAENHYALIRNELAQFDESLKHKQEVCVIHKSDLLSEELLSQITEHLRSVFFHYRERPPRDGEPLWVSSATQQGLGDLLKTLDEIFSKSTPIKLETLRRKGVVLPDGTRTELA